MKPKQQATLFDIDPDWKKEWQGMPEYVQKDLRPFQQITINFECREDVQAFAKLVGQKLTDETDTMWFPLKVPEVIKNKRYVSES
jgi:hypothetical protein